jgi:formylglycine-generating enzyme required for sulfatase activity
MKNHLQNFPALKRYVSSLCSIPAGTFRMGSVSGEWDEKPVRSVNLRAFRMGSTPVTVGVWKEYCRANKLEMPEKPRWGWIDDHPIVGVSWEDIMGEDDEEAFCAWASAMAGIRLTLPTEAQFEYASQGGKYGLNYPWGNTFDRSKLWCSAKSFGDAKRTSKVNRTTRIYKNAYGLTDMTGNVWQWCSDIYAPYSNGPENNPDGPFVDTSERGRRCLRGGSWEFDVSSYFRCTYRYWENPSYSSDTFGFRLAT